MKKYAFTFSGTEAFSGTVRGHSFLLRCMPGTYPFQRSYAHKLTTNPFAALTFIPDVYGNEMYTGTVDKKHKQFSFEASGFVLCSKYLIHEQLDRLFLYPTRLTRPTPAMERFLSAADLPRDPWARAQKLCVMCGQTLRLDPEKQSRTAGEAFAAGAGDARDLAQVLLALCRLSGIAARMVSGLVAGIPHVHCWVEVHCGGVWRALDPSAGKVVEDGYLKIAHGPDSAGCALFRDVYRASDDIVRSFTMDVQVTEHVITTRDTVPHG